MQLNLPIADELASCRSLLIAGMGGGFDIFCGLPIFFELQRRGQTAHLANLSFSQTGYLKEGLRLSDQVVGVTAESKSYVPYFPELRLAHWFKSAREQDVTVWCFNTQGAQPLLGAYRALVEHLAVDGVLLIDGGVDSLMRGDEAEMGTVLEDACSLAAVNALRDSNKNGWLGRTQSWLKNWSAMNSGRWSSRSCRRTGRRRASAGGRRSPTAPL